MLCHKDGRFMDRVYHESCHTVGKALLLIGKRKSASKKVVRIELVRG